MARSWQQRYDSAKPSYLKVNTKQFADLEAGTSILIPSPADIEEEIARLEPSTTIPFGDLRARLAERHDADGTCPVMCGMNLRIVAEVVFEALDAGVPTDQVTPVWNAIETKSAWASKLPGGIERVERMRHQSGEM